MKSRVLLPALLAAALTGLVIAGREPAGRIAIYLGTNGVARTLLTDPATRGVAAWRAGNFAAADADFTAAGRSSTYNRGLSLAATGDYALSLAYFDAVLFANPGDGDARRNREIVAARVPPVVGIGNNRGRIAADDGEGAIDKAEEAQALVLEEAGFRKRIDAGYVAADDDWLATLSDDPGEFLRLRLAAEYARRATEGLIRPAEGQSW